MRLRTTLTSLALVAVTSTLALAADAFSVRDDAGKHAEIVSPQGKPLLRYVYLRDTSSKEKNFDTAKVFAHVIAPNGETLTKGPGGLFPHHRGIFIGWNKLKQNGKSHDLWHVRNTAQLHKAFGKPHATADSAAITSSIDWIGTDGKQVIKESRTYAVSQPSGSYLQVDFSSKLTAVGGDVELNGDPEHAGVQFRPSQAVALNKSAKYTFHQEGINPKKDKDLPWVAESFRMSKEGSDWWTVQHMSHPQNPKGARWSAYRDYGRFGPFTVVKIADGESVVFRYRFLINEGELSDRKTMAKNFAKYAAE